MKRKWTKLPSGLTLEQLRNQYEVEKAIASQLKKATRKERAIIYRTMYDEVFRLVPDHTRVKRRKNSRLTSSTIKIKKRLIDNLITKSKILVEFAPGDCKFATEISKLVNFVYAIDISDQRGDFFDKPNNFKLIIYDGYKLEIEEDSADIVFSDQLIEHLHPDDVEMHFELVKRILKPSGVYVFRTPHRFSGPHDISKFFSAVAEGLHLKEWIYSEMVNILKKLDLSCFLSYWFVRGIRIPMPVGFFIFLENMIRSLPYRARREISKLVLPCIAMTVRKSYP